MCLFPYPAQPSKSKKSKKMKNRASGEDIRETTRKAIDEAVGQIFPKASPYSAVTPSRIWSRKHHSCDMDCWPEENQHAHVTRGQWNDHRESLKKAHDMIGTNGKRVDDLRDAVCGEAKATQDAIKETHDSVKDTQDAIKGTHDAIRSAHEDIRNTQEAIRNTHSEVRGARKTMRENRGEQARGHADCAAEVDRVRRLLEDEARKRDEAHLRQQAMQEAWSYAQWLYGGQADRDAANQSSSRSSSRSSRSSGSRRRRKAAEDARESERRRQREREREAEESLAERLERILGEAERANKENRDNNSKEATRDGEGDSRSHGYYGPGGSPPWPGAEGWEYRGGTWHFFPSQHQQHQQQNYFYEDFFDPGDTGGGGYVPPYRRPFRPGASGGGGSGGGTSWEQHRKHR